MSDHAEVVRRDSIGTAMAIVAAAGFVAAAVVVGKGIAPIAAVALLIPAVAVARGVLVPWHSLVGLLILVVLFVPISFYELPASLPFNLELYRIVVALVVLCWVLALLIDSRVRLRATTFDAPLLPIMACVLASEVANPSRVRDWGAHAVKSVTFFLSFLLVYYLIATAIRKRESVVLLLRILTGGSTLVAISAIIERRTGFNLFWHLQTAFPFLIFGNQGTAQAVLRGGNLRVFGSAQHPIALGAMLSMIVPISVYLTRLRGRQWMAVTVILILGILSTGSRTALVMLVTIAAVFLWLKPLETRRLWPLLIPAVVVVHFAVPQAIGGLRASFFPHGGLIAEQSAGGGPNANSQLAGGRIRQLKPMLTEASHHPLFGEGYGTRISGFGEPNRNAPILDNQWLNITLDLGFTGSLLWLWLFGRALQRLVATARRPREPEDDWLFTALAAAVAGFAVGMLTYDAFGFTQVFFIFWILLGLSAAILDISYSQRDLRAIRTL